MKNQTIPDISVVVCCYNQGKWVERCIRSLNHQTNIQQKEFEIIIINDGSADETNKVLKNIEFLDNVRTITNEKNIGLPASLNKGISESLGRYIVRVDSDDYVSKHFLYLMRLFLDMNRGYQAVATDYIVVDQFENVIETNINCFDRQIACGIMFRKECLFDVGLYNETFKMREGHELRKRFENKFRIARLEFPLYKYRQHDSNRTIKDKEILDIYDKALKEEK